jgi:acyl-CoA synthetase (AMP-forming)/AMP-acid ligase II
MGLIAGFVMPIVTGTPLVLMSPFQWVRDPKRLLWAVAKHKGTLSWLPNFAYNHMHRAIRARDLEGLDLSSWRMVINCSEPVRFDSHQKFFERFSTYGLGEHALATCYAMAENTFAVTQSKPNQSLYTDWVALSALQDNQQAIPTIENSPGATPVVSCGSPIERTDIKIGDVSGVTLPERHVGEVALRSHSMLTEYHRRPDITAQAMQDGWFLTGDLGYLAEGQLFITGRKKDLIIVGGKNIFPADLEAIANNVSGIHPGRAVAFGVYDDGIGTESVVMVCELENRVNAGEKMDIER